MRYLVAGVLLVVLVAAFMAWLIWVPHGPRGQLKTVNGYDGTSPRQNPAVMSPCVDPCRSVSP